MQQPPINEDLLSPALSPGEVSESSGVRRVNNLPLFLVGGATLIFLVIMVLVAAERAAKQSRAGDGADQEKVVTTSMAAQEIAGNYTSGIIPIATQPLEIPPLPMASEAPTLTVVRPTDLDAPPLPPNQLNQPNPSPTPAEDIAARIRQVKLQQFEEAVKAKTTVSIIAPRSTGSTPVTSEQLPEHQMRLAKLIAANQPAETDPVMAYKTRLAQLKEAGLINSMGGSGDSPHLINTGISGEEKNNVNQFAGNGQGDRWRLDSKPEPPHSPYELRAGFVIPGTLISGVNSQLPGQIMAQTSQDVFDTATGKHKLFPQGSRLVGTYSSEVVYGQARVLVAWQRIIFPDGKAMDIGAMPGADGAGYAGFTDQVDNHYLRIFGSALLMSAITAGATYSQQNQNIGLNNGGAFAPNAQSTLSSALGQQLGQVTVQMISKNMNIAPTLEIRPGYRFNIIVTKDLTLSKPYEAFDY
jgi:type IV secretory pathway VirB10-like protein